MNERLPKLVPRHLENILKQTTPQEVDKVFSITFYAEVTKRNGDTYELESLKIMHSAIERYLKEKNYPLGIVHSREFHNSKVIHRRITLAAPLNSFSKDNLKSQSHSQKKRKVFHH